MDVAPSLVCPETLEPLERTEGGWWSPRAQRSYPVREDLAFMGFPERDAEMIAATMEEERLWQGTAETVDRDRQFLRQSAPRAVELINLVTRLRGSAERARAVELGSGSGWVSWLLAEAGYDTWMCDFEANSLAIGKLYEHDRIRCRVVTDARYCPFPDAVFDVVLMKEFAHHVEDVGALFREAQRVLRPGGLVALMEPTRSVRSSLYELRHPDPHEGHHITWPDKYRWAMRRAGFELVHETAMYSDRRPRIALVRRAEQRAARDTRGMKPLSAFARVQLRLLGGASTIIVARKVRTLARASRPTMRVIDPDTLVVGERERTAFSDFPSILRQAADDLVPVIPTTEPSTSEASPA